MSEFRIFEYKMKILEHHLDTFGHVNNATYLSLYEEARWDFISQNNYGLHEILEKKKGPIVLDVSCRFKRELVNRECIIIRSKAMDIRGKITHMKQEILKEDGTLASDAVFTFGFMDMKLRKLILPTKDWLQALGVAQN